MAILGWQLCFCLGPPCDRWLPSLAWAFRGRAGRSKDAESFGSECARLEPSAAWVLSPGDHGWSPPLSSWARTWPERVLGSRAGGGRPPPGVQVGWPQASPLGCSAPTRHFFHHDQCHLVIQMIFPFFRFPGGVMLESHPRIFYSREGGRALLPLYSHMGLRPICGSIQM